MTSENNDERGEGQRANYLAVETEDLQKGIANIHGVLIKTRGWERSPERGHINAETSGKEMLRLSYQKTTLD